MLEKIWNTLRPARLQRELDEELRHHVELRARDLEKTGLSPGDAKSEARLRLGNFTLESERTRDMDVSIALETVLKDLRYAFRQLARSPVFTAVAIASLALGIGANTAIFSIFNAALLASLPVRNPQELVILTNPNMNGFSNGHQGGERNLLTYAEYKALLDRTKTISGLFASESELNRWSVRIAGGSQEDAHGRLVTENYFSALGVQPAMGRFFQQSDAAGVGSDPYAVISYDYWQRRFAGAFTAIGSPIRLHGTALTIIGIAPPGFHGESVGQRPDLWAPMMMEPLVYPSRDYLHEDLNQSLEKTMWLHVFGRLKPGVTLPKAQAEISVLFKAIIGAGYPKTFLAHAPKDWLDQRIKIREARIGALEGRNEFSQQLYILLVIAGLVLLIACANVANLLLARATARYREIAVRLAIGAAKSRLLRQFLTESLLLSFLGGTAGVVVAIAAARGLVAMFSLQLSTAFDWRVLVFTFSVTLATGILFGMAPALRGTRVDISESLKENSRSATGTGKRITVGKSLVAAQVAISLLLLVGAGLFIRTLWNLQSVNLGYAKENLLLISVDALTAGYQDAQRPVLYNQIAEHLRNVPGVQAVTYSTNGLFSGNESHDPVDVEGFIHQKHDDQGSYYDKIGPSYFSTIKVPMLLGREITIRDTANSPRVCVINESFAKAFFSGRNPIGKHVTDTFGNSKLTMEVVGVSRNIRDHHLRGDIPQRYYLAASQPDEDGIPSEVNFEIRTLGDPVKMSNAIRKSILQVNENLPVSESRVISDLIDDQNKQPRLIARLCGAFGFIALLLAATGLYGVLSYSVARRSNEIGIRMALGAGKGTVVGMILKETGSMMAVGLAAGIVVTVAFTRLVASYLYGLSAVDPITIAAAIGLLAATALLAGYIPAARAARVNPVVALRHE
jgi:predicted permease